MYTDADDSASNGDYMADQRWTALRKVGEAAGWLVDPGEVKPTPWSAADSTSSLRCNLRSYHWSLS